MKTLYEAVLSLITLLALFTTNCYSITGIFGCIQDTLSSRAFVQAALRPSAREQRHLVYKVPPAI